MDDRLYRSTTDRSIAGVCGGLAAWLGLDPSLVRIGWVLLALVSGGVFVILYVVMAVVVPDAPPGWTPRGRLQNPGQPPNWGQGYGQGWGQGWGGGAPGGTWTGGQGWQGGSGPTGTAPSGAQPTGQTPPGTPSTSWPEDWDRTPRPSPEGPFPTERAGLVAGGLLIALGVWFLVKDYVPINWDLVWPVAVIALGGILIVGAMRRSR